MPVKFKILYFLICLFTAMINYTMYHNKFFVIVSFIFTPLQWAYWIVTKSIHWPIIKQTIAFYLN